MSNSSGGRWSWSATRVPFANASFPPWMDVSPTIALQERRLAGTVRPGEREPILAPHGERDVLEQRIARELLPQLRCDEHGHLRKRRSDPRSPMEAGRYPFGGKAPSRPERDPHGNGTSSNQVADAVRGFRVPDAAHPGGERFGRQPHEVARAPELERQIRGLLEHSHRQPSTRARHGRLSAVGTSRLLEQGRTSRKAGGSRPDGRARFHRRAGSRRRSGSGRTSGGFRCARRRGLVRSTWLDRPSRTGGFDGSSGRSGSGRPTRRPGFSWSAGRSRASRVARRSGPGWSARRSRSCRRPGRPWSCWGARRSGSHRRGWRSGRSGSGRPTRRSRSCRRPGRPRSSWGARRSGSHRSGWRSGRSRSCRRSRRSGAGGSHGAAGRRRADRPGRPDRSSGTRGATGRRRAGRPGRRYRFGRTAG